MVTSDIRPFARRRTRPVRIGGDGLLTVGGDTPILVQSMTTADTMDTAAVVTQILALHAAGCPLVRVTTPSRADARNLEAIKAELRARGADVPLVADVHFTPNAALDAAELVEKVRINPGNYADRKQFKVREYTDDQYAEELERLEAAFLPLVARLKERGAALRIGTNHGSLSDRILNRFGDTPLGMAESALEFVRICERQGFHDIVLSAKASNVRVMVESYRILARMLDAAGMPYPLHVGVTEAGDGEDGRIKSAIGIGMLLAEGLGDTIRVSLTEDPVHEVPVCHEIVAEVAAMTSSMTSATTAGTAGTPADLWERPRETPTRRRAATGVLGTAPVGGSEPPRVVLELPPGIPEARLDELLRHRPASMAEMPPEVFEVRPRTLAETRDALALRARLQGVVPVILRTADMGVARAAASENVAPAIDLSCATIGRGALAAALELEPVLITFVGHRGLRLADFAELVAMVGGRLPASQPVAFDPGGSDVLRTEGVRALAAVLPGGNPILLRASSGEPRHQVRAAIELGSLLVDGIGDAVGAPVQAAAPLNTLRLLYNVLQAAGVRSSKTEFISCPSCGRTFFDLETTTARIKEKTGHLKGVKIAVMGCIVNGPGEMADADFGYVGASPGTVHLFVGKDIVEKGVPAGDADARLVELIKSRGRWVEPPSGAPDDRALATPAGHTL